MQMEAQEAGLDNVVFVDEAGNVGESSNMNVAFVTRDGVLKHPKFDHILSGCTSLRLLELARGLEGNLLRGVEVCDVPVAEARGAREMLLIGSSIKVAPVVEWDGKPIGDGKPGPIARALFDVLAKDHALGARPPSRRPVLRPRRRRRYAPGAEAEKAHAPFSTLLHHEHIAFLCKVMIVREDLRNMLRIHRIHRTTVCKAVLLVHTPLVSF